MRAPCRDCSERTVEPNCHVECQQYLEWISKKKEITEKMTAVKRVDAYFNMRKKGRRK